MTWGHIPHATVAVVVEDAHGRFDAPIEEEGVTWLRWERMQHWHHRNRRLAPTGLRLVAAQVKKY